MLQPASAVDGMGSASESVPSAGHNCTSCCGKCKQLATWHFEHTLNSVNIDGFINFTCALYQNIKGFG